MYFFIILIVDVLICCQYAVSDLLTDLGSNVTINCDLDEKEVYWILLKTADPPTLILRSLSTTASPFYSNKTFKNKYSVQFKHRLVINNVTADELGVYYCMKSGTPPKLSNSTRIYITESTQLTECHNHTAVEIIDQNQTQYQIIIIISALMNGLLIIVVIGLVKVFVVGKRKSAETSTPSNTDLQQMQVIKQHQDPNQLQYAEVDFTKLRQKNCISQHKFILKGLNHDSMNVIHLQLCEFIHVMNIFTCTYSLIVLCQNVLICCQYAVSDLLTNLGSNVIINCDLDENEVYWILLKTADPPTVILRSMSTTTSPIYLNNTFRKKYSVQFKHRLVINNVTADELGVYYCMKTGTPPKLSNSTRLYLNESTELIECHNHTVVEFIERNSTVVNCIDQNQTRWQIFVIILSLMNGLLIIVVIDVLICCQSAVANPLTYLGSNVIINCDFDENEVYWILMKSPEPPSVILQSLPNSTFYPNSTFINKYSVQFKHRLVIHNVTADELGVYFCMNTHRPPKLSKTTRIYFNEKSLQCNTALQRAQVIEQHQDSDQLQYASVDFSKLRKNRSSQGNSTYAALNLPKS
ncbi:Ig kappa chain V region 3368 [Labeo rohita]|uniref:Ig kappa chain V region 3368 n=1 Tax=Labeo rohita TaxID=84645 RepID=A0ABQ8LHY4_LABRO|nr:Ig kappa chain V region 3368 [Labeo rohita]